MKDSREIESELMGLRTSLRNSQKSRASLIEAGINWLKNEVSEAVPEEMQGEAVKWRDRAAEVLSKHPIVSVAVALCVGVALGQLWSRHHDR